MAAKPRASSQDLLTVAQVAAYLQLNKLTVYKYIREGKLPAVKLGRSFRVLKEDVRTFLEKQKVTAAPSAAGARREPPAPPSRPAEAPSRAPRAAARAPAKHSDEIHVGPSREERGKRRDEVITSNPLEWVIRGLH